MKILSHQILFYCFVATLGGWGCFGANTPQCLAENPSIDRVEINGMPFNDYDYDGVEDLLDNCRFVYNPGQENSDSDFYGNACDGDDDNDGVADELDCDPYDNSRWTDRAYSDTDNDGLADSASVINTLCYGAAAPSGTTKSALIIDNCATVFNPDQLDTDGDRLGDECDPDDDSDGIEDSKELLDGTDPLDRGSFLETLKSPAFTKYNTYLNQNNFLELINIGTRRGAVRVSVYDQNGHAIPRPRAMSEMVYLNPKQQQDISINQWVGSKDQIGLIKIEWNGDIAGFSFTGRLSVYREGNGQSEIPPTLKKYAFAYSRDLQNGNTKSSFGIANTENAEGLNPLVENWLEIVNIEKTSKRFDINIYDQNGEILYSKRRQLIPPYGEVDIPAGQLYGQGKYLVEVIPRDSNGKYLSSLSRYSKGSNDFNFASSVKLKPGTGERQILPISNLRGNCWAQGGIVELINTLNQPIMVQVRIRKADGGSVVKGRLDLSFAPRQLIEINGADLLYAGSVGSVEILPVVKESVVVQSSSYYYGCDGKLESGNTVQGLFSRRVAQVGSYNRYLSMDNIYLLTNITNSAVAVNVSVRDVRAAVVSSMTLKTLKPFETRLIDFNSSGYNTEPESYGTVAVSPSIRGAIVAQGFRHREVNGVVHFNMPSSVR